MDRQIAWLAAFQPRAAAPPPVAAVDTSIQPAEASAVDIAALRERISDTLNAVRLREREALERQLERARQSERAAGAGAERAALEDEADRRFQKALDSAGEEMANLDVRMSVTAALQRSYATRGPQWEDLAQRMETQHAALKEQLSAARARRTVAVNEVFDWLEAQFREKDAAEADAALAYRRLHQRELDALDQSIERQKNLLLESLPAAPARTADTPALSPLFSSNSVPPLPGPALTGRIVALKQRRNDLAAFILQNTEAVVKSAANRRTPPVRPVFRLSEGLPNRTDVFRPAVQRPVAALERPS